MSVNFSKNQEEIIKAWRQVVDFKDLQNWALFGYEGTTNNIKLMASGSDGLKGLVQEFNCSLIQYAFIRVIDMDIGINKLVLINWQGDSSPLSRKGLCASHVGDIVSYFKGCTQTITIRNDDEASQEYLMDQIVRASSSRLSLSKQQSSNSSKASPENVITDPATSANDMKPDKNFEISSADRKSFWQRQEEEEKARLSEEKKRAAEKQAQFEKERKLREESEAKKLAETIKERDRLIEATRQAERRGSLSSQQSSKIAASLSHDNEDERVGRRSELIRLERNQETQSLISKGLIKNKRAIFEQASQQQSQQPTQQHSIGHSTTRRPSGTIITQRVNTFTSMDGGKTSSTSNNVNVEKLANGFANTVSIDDQNSMKSNVQKVVHKETQNVKLVKDHEEQNLTNTKNVASSVTSHPIAEQRKSVEDVQTSVDSSDIKPPVENGDSTAKDIQSVQSNGGDSNCKLTESPIQESKIKTEKVMINGKAGIRAQALYDYQAADETEISFDPDDIIGFIDKVDPGWWHGSVLTGLYKGQTGLFPTNYVKELTPGQENSS